MRNALGFVIILCQGSAPVACADFSARLRRMQQNSWIRRKLIHRIEQRTVDL
jgi:hypothetical protein